MTLVVGTSQGKPLLSSLIPLLSSRSSLFSISPFLSLCLSVCHVESFKFFLVFVRRDFVSFVLLFNDRLAKRLWNASAEQRLQGLTRVRPRPQYYPEHSRIDHVMLAYLVSQVWKKRAMDARVSVNLKTCYGGCISTLSRQRTLSKKKVVWTKLTVHNHWHGRRMPTDDNRSESVDYGKNGTY